MIGSILFIVVTACGNTVPQSPTTTHDANTFLLEFKRQESAALGDYTLAGVIQRPARTASAGDTLEIVGFSAAHKVADATTVLQWELIDWTTPSYEEAVAATGPLMPPWSPGDPVQVVRVSSRSIVADAISIRMRDDHGMIEALTPGAPASRSEEPLTVEYWEHDADDRRVLHELEKIIWASGHGIAPLVLRADSVVEDASGTYSVVGAGKLSTRDKSVGVWRLELEPIAGTFIVRRAAFARSDTVPPHWTLETHGVLQGAPIPIAACGQVRFLSKGIPTTQYDVQFSDGQAGFDEELLAAVEMRHHQRHAAGRLDEFFCRAGAFHRTSFRDGKPISVPRQPPTPDQVLEKPGGKAEPPENGE